MSIRSMTGYGAGSFLLGESCYRVELRSVNHRHLDLKLRVARELGPIEMPVRNRIAERLDRGHVDVSIGVQGGARPKPELRIDELLAGRVHSALEQLRAELGLETPVALPDVLRVDGVMTAVLPSWEPDMLWAVVGPGLDEALDDLVAGREQEGARLAMDLGARLAAVARLRDEIATESAASVAGYQERVAERLGELLQREDPVWREQRLGAELALLAEKADIAEELTRVAAHVGAMEALIAAEADEGCGRKLEFYAIELNREFNTMAAKSVSASVTHRAVEAKAEVERIREQVANVE